MENFFQIIILIFNAKFSFKFLFGLIQLHLYYIYIQCIDYNIIDFNEENFKYLSFANYSNGDMIFSSTADRQTEKRIFYGFKKNGRPFFQNETNYFYSMNSPKKISSEQKFESDSLVIKLNNESEKEYLLSIGKVNSFCEIYDFENNEIYKKSMDKFANNDVLSIRNMGIFLFSNSSDHYYLFGFTIKENEALKYSLQIHKFNTIENFNSSRTNEKEIKIEDAYSEKDGISCFITENQNIICFYLTKLTKSYNIVSYNTKLEQIGSMKIKEDYIDENSFYRCIHLKGEVGVFSYYKISLVNYYPNLLFKKLSSNGIINYSLSEIYLYSFIDMFAYEYYFDTYLLKNDIIKLKENKICFSSISINDGTTIYIILINLFNNDKKYSVRYYFINLYDIYKYTIYSDIIRTHNYNNFISFAFSYIKNDDKHFPVLMLFSYPNSTDNSSDLYEFLINNYNSTIDDFSVYIFDSILIQNISNCLNPQIISSSSNKKIIESNTSLSKRESIKLKFINNNYSSFNCNIEYIPVSTEPDLNIYDKYPLFKDGKLETSNDFMKEKYYGRLTYYYIYLSESLNDNCADANCHLCLDNNISFCIICKNNFTFVPLTKEKHCNGNINYETTYLNIETEKTNITYKYETNETESDIEEQKVKSDIDTNTNKIESTSIKKEETTQIETDISDIKIEAETQKIINNISETANINVNTEEKMTETINKYSEGKIELKIDKNKIIEEIPKIIEDIKIGGNYEMTGDDFIMSIRPTKSFINSNSTHVDFSTCEKLLRSTHHIDESRIITFLQLEIMNKNDKS